MKTKPYSIASQRGKGSLSNPARRPRLLARRILSIALFASMAVPAAAQSDPNQPPVPNPLTWKVQVKSSIQKTGTSARDVKATVLADGLKNPWSLAFLQDGRMLVTERTGRLLLVSTNGVETSLTPVAGVPAVFAQGQGGLLDVQVDPASPRWAPWIYWSYAEPGTGHDAGKAGTAVARGMLAGEHLQQVAVIFRQKPKVSGTGHFGSRLVFAKDAKTLFVTLGERQLDQPANPGIDNAQNLQKHLGKVVRVNKNGTVPLDNPKWTHVAGALPEIWSYGHRNPQGAALHPVTGDLWVGEHGPQGGDEVNLALPGRNFGWPLYSYGCPYEVSPAGSWCWVGGGKHPAPQFTEPLIYGSAPSAAPSGLAFYTASKLPEWRGSLFQGTLRGTSLERMTLNGNAIVGREVLFKGTFGRIRDVRQGPDGWLYLLTDSTNGKLIRIER